MKRLLFCALACTSVAAQALSYVESTDFPDATAFGPGSFSVGTLDVGANSVSGGLAGMCVIGDCNPPGHLGDTQDSFLITVAAGTMLQSLVVTTSNATGPNGFSVSLDWRSSSTAIGFEPFIPVNGTSGNVLAAPLGPGEYALSVFGQQAAEAGAYQVSYDLALDVAAVPEPATALLLACGGLLLAARRRSR